MSDLRPFALIRTGDQWIRCSFDNTFLDYDTGVVELKWTTTTADSNGAAPAVGAGLAFDRECRLYHARPAEGRIERFLWGAVDSPGAMEATPVNLIDGGGDARVGDFASPEAAVALHEPRGLAVDVDDRLFIAETGLDRILVFDLWSDRLIRQIVIPGARPADLAASGNDVYAVLTAQQRIVRLTARSDPRPFDLPQGCVAPSRIAVSPAGRIAILESAGSPSARVWFADPSIPSFAQPKATDLEWESESGLVVARQAGADFLRYAVGTGEQVQRSSLRARGYDGLGIVAVSPDSRADAASPVRRIGYWTANGFRIAVAARAVFERSGRVATFRLDSGEYQTVWGRLFLDACIPTGADLRVHYVALDEAEDETPIPRIPPANVQHVTVRRPDLSPPMPPAIDEPGPGEVTQPLHLKESGRELPWTEIAASDFFDTYEAPITAGPGRYLWITLELRGNTRVSPKVRSIRAEHPSHDYLRRLPATFTRDANAASFLRRYLAMFEGFLGEVDARGVDRDLLVDPRSTPDECLPWLASFVGMILDERWASAPSGRDVRRTMIEEAVWLFRYRGTLPGLKRFIEIYTGVQVIVMEHYRLRGIGAAVLGDTATAFSSSVVGEGFRIGGSVGTDTPTSLSGTTADAFRTHAHRFTVIVPSVLSDEQLSVVNHIIDVHRPAHTIFDVCAIGGGMRVGRGLLLEVSSIVGRTGGFSPMQLGAAVIGRGNTIGRPGEGGVIGTARIGRGTRVG